MSHTVRRRSQCTNEEGVTRAAQRMGAQVLGHGRHRLYDGTRTGFGVKLPGWRYPIVFDLTNGNMAYDHYNGSWGNPERLNDFKQGYTLEMGKKTAEEKGHRVEEVALDNGDVELKIHIGGGGGGVAGDSGGLTVGPSL